MDSEATEVDSQVDPDEATWILRAFDVNDPKRIEDFKEHTSSHFADL
jgi:hypothetical protein